MPVSTSGLLSLHSPKPPDPPGAGVFLELIVPGAWGSDMGVGMEHTTLCHSVSLRSSNSCAWIQLHDEISLEQLNQLLFWLLSTWGSKPPKWAREIPPFWEGCYVEPVNNYSLLNFFLDCYNNRTMDCSLLLHGIRIEGKGSVRFLSLERRFLVKPLLGFNGWVQHVLLSLTVLSTLVHILKTHVHACKHTHMRVHTHTIWLCLVQRKKGHNSIPFILCFLSLPCHPWHSHKVPFSFSGIKEWLFFARV